MIHIVLRLKYTISFFRQFFPVRFFLQFIRKKTEEARVYTISQKSSVFFSWAVESDTEFAAAALIIAVILKRKRKKRSTWVKPWLQKRQNLGMYDTLQREFR